MHRAAKEVVVRWMREVGEAAGCENWAKFGSVSWRANREGPAWGVWMEYPFTEGGGGRWPVWDEWECGFEDAPPAPAWCKAEGLKIICVADIALQHKGDIGTVIEVVHRNPVSAAKRRFYDAQGFHLYEISASWVMKQTKRPAGFVERIR